MVKLMNNQGYSWSSENNVWAKGYAFDLDNNYHEASSLVNFFLDVKDFQDYRQRIESLNGLFAVVVKNNEDFYLATDITRTFPLFYIRQNNQWVISDDANLLKRLFNLEVDRKQAEEFLFSGYMIENKTLVKEINQVRAHEIVSLSEEIICHEYFSYAVSKVTDDTFGEFQKKLLQSYQEVGRRLIKSLRGRTAVLPLSGGYDSRLVLTILKEQGYEKIICFSYGSKSSYELSIAADVSNSLNVKFIKINYSNEFIAQNLEIEEFIEYELFSGNLASLPHIQDFLAVKYLKSEELIPADAVFIPGIAGDIYSGTQIPKGFSYHSCNVDIDDIIKKRYLNFTNEEFTSEFNKCSNCFDYSLVENFCVKEKVPKFVANSVRVYEFLGFSYLLPLMDKVLLNLFSSVPVEFKNTNDKKNYCISSNLYDATNFILFKKHGIAFKKNDNRIVFARYFNFLKRRLGLSVDGLNNLDSLIISLEKDLKIDTLYFKHKNINLSLSRIYLKILSLSK